MSVSVKVEDLTRARDVLLLYSKKAAFNIEEYVDVGNVYKSIASKVEDAKETDSVDVPKQDILYVIQSMNVCAQRAPIELQNYKPIAALFETLGAIVKQAEEEESKE
jgi:hypothetical protein